MRIKLFSLLAVVFISTSLFAKATGEELFKQCKACHTLTEDRLVGPGLAGVTEKRDHEWLKSWIRSSTKLIASGDADAKALFDEYKIPMADYDLSDEDMESLLSYMAGDKAVEEVVEAEAPAKEVAAVETKTEETAEVVEEVKVKEESDFSKALKNRPLTKWLFGLSIFLLLGVLIAAIKIYRSTKED